jgi:hypothetical protein
MDSVGQGLMKRVSLLFACSVGVTMVLAVEFSRHQLSPRGLGIGLLIVCIFIGAVVASIVGKSHREFNAQAGQPAAAAIDAVTRKRLLSRMRRAKITIVLMFVVLVLGLTQIRLLPIGPLIIGVAINLLTTAKSVQTVIRLKRILN